MLSIIINHYKSPEVLKLCLKYVKQNAPQGSEMIVTDSETIEQTRLLMQDYPNVTFLTEEKNVGFAKSVNRGLRNAHGTLFLIINADVIVPRPQAIPKMVACMETNKDIGMLGPKLLNINGAHQPSAFRFYSPKTILARRTFFGKTPWGKKELARFLQWNPRASIIPSASVSARPTDWLMGSALLVRRKAYEDVGPLDENFFMYMEDVDWCRRFWQNKWKVAYYPNAFFYHYHFQASKKQNSLVDIFTNKYARTHLVSALKYFKKHGLKAPALT